MTDPGSGQRGHDQAAAPGGAQRSPGQYAPAHPRPGRSRGATAMGGTLALRLTLAFVAVALAAVALFAGLTAAFAAADVAHLASTQRRQLTTAIGVAAGTAWERNRSWAGADLALAPVLDLAERVGADVQIRDRAGRPVASSPGFASHPARPRLAVPIVVAGTRAGLTVVAFPQSALADADQSLREALLRAIAGTAGLAALLALVAGLGAARWITRPIGRLIAVTRAMGAGDRNARVGPVAAPGELAELAAAFDQMASALERQEQLRRDMVADVAHELRTPVAILQAGHEALADGVAEPTPAQLASLREEVLRLGRMVGDLQTLADADAAALRLALRPANLAAIAAAAAGRLADRFTDADITLDRQLTPVRIRADEGRVQQVITNLLTNALKFTPPGGRVTIRAGPAAGRAVLQVIDTGQGIPADELPRIFDRFWRGRGAARSSGSGIGLAIAAGLARAHGGELTAASTEGHGTQLTLTLPQA